MSTVRIRIGPADQGRTMSLEEFREAEEQPGYLYELSRGMLDAREVPQDAHGKIVDNAHEGFSSYRRRHPGLTDRIAHGSDVRLIIRELESDRHPDVAIVFRNAPRDARDGRMPELVVEVVSPGVRARRRDYEEKREEYLSLGIREFWIVDPYRNRRLCLYGSARANPRPGVSAHFTERIGSSAAFCRISHSRLRSCGSTWRTTSPRMTHWGRNPMRNLSKAIG
jgi:Uma2 family endonuclease